MIRRATRADIPAMVGMYKTQYAEKGFNERFTFNAPRLSKTLLAATEDPDSLLLVSESGMLYATCMDSPLGIGKLAVEQIVRGSPFNDFRTEYEEWARSKGCIEASFSCTDRHQAFARFYGRNGYTLSESTFSKAL